MKVQVFISSCCEVVLKASSVASTYKASRGLHALARTARVSCLWRPAGSVRVQACAAVGTDNSASLFFDAGTGRVASADGQRCLTAQQRTGVDPCARVYTSLFDPRVCTHQPANSTAILGRSAARELLCYIPGSF
eukprot:m.964171 g.964171  ORF g.964171 m.964171 type:complete len:135 (+) comp23902_c0_seq6:95-499(+)